MGMIVSGLCWIGRPDLVLRRAPSRLLPLALAAWCAAPVGASDARSIDTAAKPAVASDGPAVQSESFKVAFGPDTPNRATWDVSTNTGIQPGNGNWGSDNFWTRDGTTLTSWPGAGNTAEFAGAGGNWTLNVNGTVQADSLVFSSPGYTLVGGTINLSSGSPAILTDADATIASNLSGQIVKIGSAKLALSGNNSGVWAFTHRAGTTLARTTGALGAGNVTIDGKGKLQISGGTNLANHLVVNACDPGQGAGALSPDSGTSAEWSGSLAINADCNAGGTLAGAAGNSGTLTLSGSLNTGGTATCVRQRSSTVVYKGGGNARVFELIDGTARLGAANGLPPGAVFSQPHGSYAAILELNGFNQSFQAIHSGSNPGSTIRNSQGYQCLLSLTGNVDTTFNGTLSGNLAVAKSGSGRQTFAGANTHQGPTTISGGILRIAHPRALGDVAGPTTVAAGGALDLWGQNLSDPEPVTISGTGPSGAGAIVNGSKNTASFAGPLTLGGNASIQADSGAIVLTGKTAVSGNGNSLTLGGTARDCRIDAPISTAGGGLAKTGTGAWSLQAQSTYTGPTAVNGGTLVVNGAIASSSKVSVFAGAVLGGNGTVNGSVTGRGGTVSPGSPDTVGQLSVQSLDLSTDSGSTLRIRIKATTKPATDYDRLAVAGALTLGGKSVLELDLAELAQTGTASGVVAAGGVVGQFSAIRIRNNAGNFSVDVAYTSGLVNVAISRSAPSFSKGPSQTVREDAGRVDLPGWAGAISAGSGPAGQSSAFRATTDRPGLFSILPSVSSDGTLSFAPAPDSNGKALVKIRLGASDNPDSSALDSFAIAVSPVNDAPRFVPGGDIVATSLPSERTIAGWATSIVAGPPDESGQSTGFRLSHSNPSLYSVQPTLSAKGTLQFAIASGALGTDTLQVRLGDDGGSSDGGSDSSAVATFHISVKPPASLRIRPDTLRMRPGDTARFSASVLSPSGTDSGIDGASVAWTWRTPLGELSAGRVAAHATGTTRVVAKWQDMTDSATLIVSDLDTACAPSTDSVTLRAAHRISIVVPPHGGTLRVSLTVRDSVLAGRGIQGADSAVLVSVGVGAVQVNVPATVVPASARLASPPSVFWLDSAGALRMATSTATTGSVSFSASGTRAWWLGYDTMPPSVSAAASSDSIATDSVTVGWTISDNVAAAGGQLCLQKAGEASASCRELDAGASKTGSIAIFRSNLPLGGRFWMVGRDSRNTSSTVPKDLIVKLDTLKAPWDRTEDRYDLLAFPYVRGPKSAHETFRAQWGDDDPHHWRVFAADSDRFQEVQEGSSLDAAGRGFWVRTRQRALDPWTFGHWTTPMSVPVKISLAPGWNAVGNPLGFPVSWRQIWELSGSDSATLIGPYEFDASTQGWSIPDTAMRWDPWRGAAILNLSNRIVDLLVPSSPRASSARSATSPGGSATASSPLRISVQASQLGNRAPTVWMGLDHTPNAWLLPPTPHDALRAFLENPSRAKAALLADVRFPSDSSPWTLRVTGLVPHRNLSLRWTRSGTDTSSKIWIRDDKSSRWIPYSELSEFAVGDEDERTFQVLAGSRPTLAAPRPFAVGVRGQALSWSLPDHLGRTHVRIEALNPLGCRLATLVNEDMDPGSYGRALKLSSPTGQVLLVLTAGGEQTSSRWLLRR